MKKILVLILFSAFVFTGCAYYTCPTYAEGPAQSDKQDEDTYSEVNTTTP